MEQIVRQTQRERKEATVAKLLDATLRSILEVGYGRTSIQEICSRAQVSHGGLFRHFASRTDLMIAVVAELSRRRYEEFQDIVATGEGVGGLAELAAALGRYTATDNNAISQEFMVAARTDETLGEAMLRITNQHMERLRPLFADLPGAGDIPEELLEPVVFLLLQTFNGDSLMDSMISNSELQRAKGDLLHVLLWVIQSRTAVHD